VLIKVNKITLAFNRERRGPGEGAVLSSGEGLYKGRKTALRVGEEVPVFLGAPTVKRKKKKIRTSEQRPRICRGEFLTFGGGAGKGGLRRARKAAADPFWKEEKREAKGVVSWLFFFRSGCPPDQRDRSGKRPRLEKISLDKGTKNRPP